MKRRGPARADLPERILAFLRRRAQPASSHELAREFLRISVGSEELATRLLRSLLEPVGADYREGTGWVAPSRSPALPDRRSTLPSDVALGCGAGAVAAAVDRITGEVEVTREDGTRPSDLAGATVVLLEPARDGPALRAWVRARGGDPPAAVVSLRSMMAGVVRLPRRPTLEDIGSALGLRWLERDTAAGIAAAMAACLAEASARREASPALEEAVPPEVAGLPGGIAPGTLAALPEQPGVYRFFDDAGRLIYIGKAANLRRRVSSYFTAAAARSPRRFYRSIHSLAWRTTGSELEALLEEARLIERRGPRGNVQTRVHERGRRYGEARSRALLVPRADGRGVAAVLIRDGRYLGHLTIGPRGGGLAGARQLLGHAVCSRGGRSRGRPHAPAPGPELADRDTEVLTSWLARHGESVSRVDLDGFRKASEAERALRDAARVLLADRHPTVFR